MQIAIIGSGNVGRALAGSSTRAGHSVTLSSANAEHARSVAQQTGAQAAASNREAVATAELVILAVPYPEVESVLADLDNALDGKVVVDATNRVSPADPASVLDGTSAAEQIQARVPAARVIKGFNTAFAARQADPLVAGVPTDGFVAGDDTPAKASVLELVTSIGFRAIDAGPLAMARVLEGMALLNITRQIRTQGAWQAGWKLLEPGG